jgi:hypothetical protein
MSELRVSIILELFPALVAALAMYNSVSLQLTQLMRAKA